VNHWPSNTRTAGGGHGLLLHEGRAPRTYWSVAHARSHGLPCNSGRSALTASLSRPARASYVLRPVGLQIPPMVDRCPEGFSKAVTLLAAPPVSAAIATPSNGMRNANVPNANSRYEWPARRASLPRALPRPQCSPAGRRRIDDAATAALSSRVKLRDLLDDVLLRFLGELRIDRHR
jgi:hypothetical protein